MFTSLLLKETEDLVSLYLKSYALICEHIAPISGERPFVWLCLNKVTFIKYSTVLWSGEVLGALCQQDGGVTYASCRSQVLELVRSNLERQMTDDDASRSEHESTRQLMEKLTAGTRERVSFCHRFVISWNSFHVVWKPLFFLFLLYQRENWNKTGRMFSGYIIIEYIFSKSVFIVSAFFICVRFLLARHAFPAVEWKGKVTKIVKI